MGDQRMRHQPAPPPQGSSADPAWTRAGQWLSDGPGERPPQQAVLGVPASTTSLSPTGAHTTPMPIRSALWRYSTFAASRGVDITALAAVDLGGGVHVDLDVDVCDRSVAPACPASLPGELPAHDLREAAYLAGLHPAVRSADIVEIDATADTADQRTVRLGALCVLELAAGLARRGGALP